MLSTDYIRGKEVISICDGRSLGFVFDIEIDLCGGVIEGIIIPAERRFFGLFGKHEPECVIKWKDIKTIGEDVILASVTGLIV